MPAPDLAALILATPVDQVGGKVAKHVALAIAIGWTDPDGRARFLHQDVADALGLCRKSVGRAVEALRDAGLIDGTTASACRFLVDQWERQSHGGDVAMGTAVPSMGTAVPMGTPVHGNGSPIGRERQSHQWERQSHRGERRSRAVSRTSTSLPPSPSGLTSQEEGGTRAGDGNASPLGTPVPMGTPVPSTTAWEPTAAEAKSLAWVERHAMPLVLPNGDDLRPAWVAALRHLTPTEAEEIRTRMVGDLPSAFRTAAAPYEPIRLTRAKQTAALVAEQAAARRVEEGREEERKAMAKLAAARAAVDDAERGTYLEQGRAILAAIAAEPGRAAVMTARTRDLVQLLRKRVEEGRVPPGVLGAARNAWNETAAPALPEAAVAAAEPYDDQPPNPDHPAAPDRDHPLVILDDDAPPVDEDPVVVAIRDFLKGRGMEGDAHAVDAWLAHLVGAGAALTSADANLYLDLALRVAAQRGIVVAAPQDVPSAALIQWAAIAGEAVA